MTRRESEVVAYHLDQLEALLGAGADPIRTEGLMHLGAVRKIVGGAHGASSHGSKRRRGRTPASPPAGDGASSAP
jgi:hypothetical protein